MLREIVLDTETTGLKADQGDRIIEIGCIELVNRIPTGREFHRYIHPDRDVPAEVEAVHGISTAFLQDKPRFGEIADDFLSFIAEDQLVIHNAAFDVGFINAELQRLRKARLGLTRVVDTLELARRKHPAGPNTLDALCKRYGIDNTKRTKHGALVDSLLLAEVYVELLGERQAALVLSKMDEARSGAATRHRSGPAELRKEPLSSRLTAADEAAHLAFIESLGPKAIWRDYLQNDDKDAVSSST